MRRIEISSLRESVCMEHFLVVFCEEDRRTTGKTQNQPYRVNKVS